MAKTIVVNDSLQQNYRYELTQPVGQNYDVGFAPQLTPPCMLSLGVFGGHYFTNEHDEFPAKWFEGGRLSDHHDPHMNHYDIDASQSRSVWEQKGWIHPNDPRGWFQWYCRYYMGRRSDDDSRQIKRWRQMTRHIGQIKAHCTPGDQLCRRRQRQALLHWAYDSREL